MVVKARRKYYRKRVNPAVKNEVKRQIKSTLARQVELKEHVAATVNSVSTAGTINKLTEIPCDPEHRIGEEINVRSLELHGNITYADATNFVRLIIFQWRPYDSTAPTVGDILGNASRWWDGYNGSTDQNYTILWDKTFCVADVHNPILAFKKKLYKRFASRLEYGDGQATLTGFHQLYAFIISDSSAASHPTVNLYSRVLYKDM